MIITKTPLDHQEILCNFSTQTWRTRNQQYYRCCVYSTRIFEDTELRFRGVHKEEGRTHEEVTAIEFNNCEMSRIPRGLLKIFPSLQALSVYNSKLKALRREDLREYRELTDFYFADNDIEFLPGDLFDDCPRVEVVSLYGNKIRHIDEGFLVQAQNLKYLDLEGNSCIDRCFDSLGSEGNASLGEIRAEIAEKFSVSHWKSQLEEAKVEAEKRASESQQLRANEDALKEELRRANRKYLKMKIDGEKMREKIEALESRCEAATRKLDRWESHARHCEEVLVKILTFSCSFYDRVLQL